MKKKIINIIFIFCLAFCLTSNSVFAGGCDLRFYIDGVRVTSNTSLTICNPDSINTIFTISPHGIDCDSTGNAQWYKDGLPIGANSGMYIATCVGTYYCKAIIYYWGGAHLITTPTVTVTCPYLNNCGNNSSNNQTSNVNTISPNTETKLVSTIGSGIFSLIIPDGKIAELEIYNLLGKLIRKETVSNSKTEIDLSAEQSGLYIISVATDERRDRFKIVKE